MTNRKGEHNRSCLCFRSVSAPSSVSLHDHFQLFLFCCYVFSILLVMVSLAWCRNNDCNEGGSQGKSLLFPVVKRTEDRYAKRNVALPKRCTYHLFFLQIPCDMKRLFFHMSQTPCKIKGFYLHTHPHCRLILQHDENMALTAQTLFFVSLLVWP